MNWEELIPIAQQFVHNNINSILKIRKVAKGLGVRAQDLTIQFEYRTNISLKKFIGSEKLKHIEKIFKNSTPETFKSSAAALECGFKDKACLASFLKHQIVKTITEFYQEVLNHIGKTK